jgi:hypothetical protein
MVTIPGLHCLARGRKKNIAAVMAAAATTAIATHFHFIEEHVATIDLDAICRVAAVCHEIAKLA